MNWLYILLFTSIFILLFTLFTLYLILSPTEPVDNSNLASMSPSFTTCPVKCGEAGMKVKIRTILNDAKDGGKECEIEQKECSDGILSRDGKTCTVYCKKEC